MAIKKYSTVPLELDIQEPEWLEKSDKEEKEEIEHKEWIKDLVTSSANFE